MKERGFVQIFQEKLLSWFEQNKRDLPWRRSYKPYHVWISEIMLQQTQMERGVEYFKRWIEIFPDIESIANASEQQIFKAWEGLGYYSRARNIKKAAVQMLENHDAKLPNTYVELLALPGIGPYTSAAIMSIAFNQPYPVIDANVERVMSRVLDISIPIKEKESLEMIKEYTDQLVKIGSPRDVNQALMEFGALFCTQKRPDCKKCPLNRYCKAYAANTVLMRPIKKSSPETIDIVMACAIIERKGKYFIQQRHEDDVWGGLWEFPGGRIKDGESAEQAATRELQEETEIIVDSLEKFTKVIHFYTRYRVTLHSFWGKVNGTAKPRLHAATQYRWVSLDELDDFAFPSGHRQLIEKMKKIVLRVEG